LSTILKALKHIDQTTPPEDLQSWPPKINTKETVKSRVQKIRLNRKVYLAALLTLPASTGPSENGPVYQTKIYPPASKQTKDPAADMAHQRADIKSAPKQTQMDKQSEPLPRMPARQKADKNPIFTATGKTETLPKSPSSTSRISPSQTADHKKAVRSKTRASAALPPKKSRSAVKQDSRSYRRLDDSKLQLQAIAWSKKAAQRIAVINGHIVREGESVEGFSVTQIRQDDIIVNDGTQSWQVEFRLK
jgi:hypothetical protein